MFPGCPLGPRPSLLRVSSRSQALFPRLLFPGACGGGRGWAVSYPVSSQAHPGTGGVSRPGALGEGGARMKAGQR